MSRLKLHFLALFVGAAAATSLAAAAPPMQPTNHEKHAPDSGPMNHEKHGPDSGAMNHENHGGFWSNGPGGHFLEKAKHFAENMAAHQHQEGDPKGPQSTSPHQSGSTTASTGSASSGNTTPNHNGQTSSMSHLPNHQATGTSTTPTIMSSNSMPHGTTNSSTSGSNHGGSNSGNGNQGASNNSAGSRQSHIDRAMEYLSEARAAIRAGDEKIAAREIHAAIEQIEEAEHAQGQGSSNGSGGHAGTSGKSGSNTSASSSSKPALTTASVGNSGQKSTGGSTTQSGAEHHPLNEVLNHLHGARHQIEDGHIGRAEVDVHEAFSKLREATRE